MGQMPPGAEGVPGGYGEQQRIMPGIMAMSVWGVARGSAGLTRPGLRGVSASRKWWSKNKAFDNSLFRHTGTMPHTEIQRPRPSFGMVATEAGVLNRLTKPSALRLFGAGKKFKLEERGFVSKGIWENALTHINLASGKPYSEKTLRSMGTRLWRVATMRGGDFYGGAATLLDPKIASGYSKEALRHVVTSTTAGMMPENVANLTGKIAANRFGAAGARFATAALPVVSFYFTAKLTADIAEWSTKKVLRGLNWYYFKMPLQAYRAGTASLRAPILNSGAYVDTPGAQTNRQRAVQAIQNSRLNARSALGSEGALMHNYFG
jgi:hypothetical protein